MPGLEREAVSLVPFETLIACLAITALIVVLVGAMVFAAHWIVERNASVPFDDEQDL